MLKISTLLLAITACASAWAQQPAPTSPANPVSPITMLDDRYLNSIQLLQNRFRIDHEVDEITMLFFREYGTAPIVLVRPDGSKIFQSDNHPEGIEWYDDATYDMVKITRPMPGPWQAVGQMLPGSRVMVVSDVQLVAEPLPGLMFSGEIIKLKAHLTNAGKPIEYNEFRDVVELTVEFLSTNNPNFTNFGTDSQVVARYEDNGMGMDEYPNDGVFTGQFNLNITEGQWKPVYRVSTPMYTREEVKEPLVLHPNPVILSIQNDQGDGRHRLHIDVNRELVDINSLLVDGKIRYPNGDVQSFSITDSSAQVREHEILNIEYGVFRVKITAYGKTIDGRDFILDVPEFSFLSEEPELAALDSELSADDETLNNASESTASEPNPLAEVPAPVVVEEFSLPEEPKQNLLPMILVANSLLLVIGGLVIWLTLGRDKGAKSNGFKFKLAMPSIKLPTRKSKQKKDAEEEA
ncbi:TIGR03503 family protein [Bowmanella yangjiangensis]|uniref:TIGR03503 family protein n=1 Tax=Bowmanella yangjiangensis TaxID=2811230 RepID=A0ABS3CY97_9ALTE|nr:TIGR03503 family protein [Bowmanella yangjiangensis]MBN7822103.1 TIGR03503 family protein [Bowmanella yangjiangensis]